MNIRDLEYLVALHEHRHFGRAAASCHVSQPTLSMQVKKLESVLGVSLIERSSRSVLFTPVGEEVVERAQHVLNEVHDIEGIARRARNPRSGSLRLGLFPTLGPYLLPHMIEPWREAFPELEVLLVEEKTAVLLERLLVGSLDAIAVAAPLGPEVAGLVTEPLFREPFDLAAPAGHPLAAGAPLVDAAALEGVDLLLLEDGHCLRAQALDVCRNLGAEERDGFRATSLETLRYMVAGGVGATLLPRLATLPPVAPLPGLVVRAFTGEAPYRDIVLAWRSTSTHAGVLRELAALVHTHIPKILTAQRR